MSSRPNDNQLRLRQIYGLVLVALLLLLVGLTRAIHHTVFPPGWWRIW